MTVPLRQQLQRVRQGVAELSKCWAGAAAHAWRLCQLQALLVQRCLLCPWLEERRQETAQYTSGRCSECWLAQTEQLALLLA